MRLLLPLSLLAAGCAATTPPPNAQAEAEAAAQAAAAAAAAEPPPAPELELEVLTAKQAVGLAIHNRGKQQACIHTTLKLTPSDGDKAAEVEMPGFGNGEVVLAPGTEFYWPSDWGIGEPVAEESVADLSGTYRFQVQACEGSYAFDSAAFDLAPGQPARAHASVDPGPTTQQAASAAASQP